MSAQSLLLRLAARYGIRYVDASAAESRRVLADDGLDLHFLDWRGDGEIVLFLHGGALTGHTWDLVCLGLRDRWRCLALDLRGHGESGWADEYRIETAIADIATLATHHASPRIHLVGNSLGGMVAAHFAAAHPQCVASLTLVDVGPNVNFAATQRIRDYIDHTDGAPDWETAIEHGLEVNPRIDRDALQYRLLHSMRQREDGRLYWRQDRRRMHDYAYFLGKLNDISRLAPDIHIPALVLRGARSRVFSDAAAKHCAALFPRGAWARIEESGHNVQESNPADFIAVLEPFLRSAADANSSRTG